MLEMREGLEGVRVMWTDGTRYLLGIACRGVLFPYSTLEAEGRVEVVRVIWTGDIQDVR